ncbi:Acetyl-coenzyme A synthetase [bioreactor metagenome]|uniref:Acetyl-coenzyme A synthetase n=1 Tax=bioreactor metagenome TaxID=1076179 RepID=A0A645E2J2_9ZZZZ
MEGYGQTELVLVASTLFYMEPKPGSMGKAVPYLPLDIVDDDGNTVDNGVNGEIVLRCTPSDKQYGIFKGYYKDEEMTNSVWQNGMYHTGDIAWRDEDGYLWFVSRKDDVIKSSGYRIGPFEVESVLMEHPAVVECAVTGAPDPVRGQVVKATVVLAKGYEPTEELKKDIQNYVKTHTAPYKYPRIVDFVDSLPKTISSKIRRVEIRESDKAKSYSD